MASGGGLHHHHHQGSVNCQLLPLVGCCGACGAGAWSLAGVVGPSGEYQGRVIFVVQCSRWNVECGMVCGKNIDWN